MSAQRVEERDPDDGWCGRCKDTHFEGDGCAAIAEVKRLRAALEQIARLGDEDAAASYEGNTMEALLHAVELAQAALQQSHAQDYLRDPPSDPAED